MNEFFSVISWKIELFSFFWLCGMFFFFNIHTCISSFKLIFFPNLTFVKRCIFHFVKYACKYQNSFCPCSCFLSPFFFLFPFFCCCCCWTAGEFGSPKLRGVRSQRSLTCWKRSDHNLRPWWRIRDGGQVLQGLTGSPERIWQEVPPPHPLHGCSLRANQKWRKRPHGGGEDVRPRSKVTQPPRRNRRVNKSLWLHPLVTSLVCTESQLFLALPPSLPLSLYRCLSDNNHSICPPQTPHD